MKESLGIGAIVAGLLGFLGAGTIFSSSDSNIIIGAGAFLVLCSLLSIARGVKTWKQKSLKIFNYNPLLVTAGIAGAVTGMALMALAFN